MARDDAVPRAREFAERIAWLGPAAVKPMFGGAAVLVDGAMVAFVVRGTLFLRVDDVTRANFEARGAAPFTYERAGETARMASYYEAPDDVVEDDDALRAVLTAGHRAALAAKAKRRR